MKHTRFLLLAILLITPARVCWGSVGDVAFRIDNRAWRLSQEGLAITMDLSLEIDAASSVAATGWGAVVTITPQPGATGVVQFSPPAIVANMPNLSAALTNPFLDFDRDAAGMAYGELGATATELNIFAPYVAPQAGPPPTLDTHGNLTLPDNVGLVSLPIMASADAAGAFLVALNPNPAVTGVVFATGAAPPDDVAVHPVAAHQGGLLTIVNPPGDYTHDGAVTGADFLRWQRGLSPDPFSAGDLAEWQAHYGVAVAVSAAAAVPEPAAATLLFVGALLIGMRRPR